MADRASQVVATQFVAKQPHTPHEIDSETSSNICNSKRGCLPPSMVGHRTTAAEPRGRGPPELRPDGARPARKPWITERSGAPLPTTRPDGWMLACGDGYPPK